MKVCSNGHSRKKYWNIEEGRCDACPINPAPINPAPKFFGDHARTIELICTLVDAADRARRRAVRG